MICPVAIVFLHCAVALVQAGDGDFNYNDFTSWGGKCNIGKRQSPINLSRNKAKLKNVEPLVFIKYGDLTHYEINNNGHAVQLKIDQSCPIGISGGQLGAFYILDNIHFHWKSEHTFNGKRHALEAHFVHYKDVYKNVTEASKHTDGLAVLGVLFKRSDEENDGLARIMPYFGNYSEVPVTPKDHIIPESLLPENRNGFFRYAGSLTTPPCSESVIWSVFNDTPSISAEQIDLMYNIRFNLDRENSRPTVKLNSRSLHFMTDFDSTFSCSRKTHVASALCLLMSLSRIFPRGYHQTFH